MVEIKRKELEPVGFSLGMSALVADRPAFIHGKLPSHFSQLFEDILACKDILKTHR